MERMTRRRSAAVRGPARDRDLVGSVPRLAGLCAVVASFWGCGPSMPPPEASPRQRFDWSAERYGNGKYADAIRGLRDHLFRDPLDPTADSARFLLADSYLNTEQELLAANEFRQLVTTRPNSPLADDAQFGMCRAYWKLSPDVPRDQDFTNKTVEECTRLAEYYPRSPLVSDAQAVVAQAREKLASKRLRVGKYYFDRRLYESALIYFELLLQEYPESSAVPEALGYLHDAYERRGFQREADMVRQRLLESYPDTPAARRLAGTGESEG